MSLGKVFDSANNFWQTAEHTRTIADCPGHYPGLSGYCTWFNTYLKYLYTHTADFLVVCKSAKRIGNVGHYLKVALLNKVENCIKSINLHPRTCSILYMFAHLFCSLICVSIHFPPTFSYHANYTWLLTSSVFDISGGSVLNVISFLDVIYVFYYILLYFVYSAVTRSMILELFEY